jgi:hypothetical protein
MKHPAILLLSLLHSGMTAHTVTAPSTESYSLSVPMCLANIRPSEGCRAPSLWIKQLCGPSPMGSCVRAWSLVGVEMLRVDGTFKRCPYVLEDAAF